MKIELQCPCGDRACFEDPHAPGQIKRMADDWRGQHSRCREFAREQLEKRGVVLTPSLEELVQKLALAGLR